MAKASARILPSLEEKRYVTLQFLEGAYISGTKVRITPVKSYELSELSKEMYTYHDPIDCYIIYNERPKVSLLKQHGWYRDNQEGPLPQIAQIATHLLYSKADDTQPIHDVQLLGNDMSLLVKNGESTEYILKPLSIKRGTLIDVFYDFAPDSESRFIVVEPFIDTISINYTCNIMPYRYNKLPEVNTEDNTRPNTNNWLQFDPTKHDL